MELSSTQLRYLLSGREHVPADAAPYRHGLHVNSNEVIDELAVKAGVEINKQLLNQYAEKSTSPKLSSALFNTERLDEGIEEI